MKNKNIEVLDCTIRDGGYLNNWKFNKRSRSSDPHIRAKAQQVKFGKVQSFDELDAVMNEWRPQYAVVDSQPERK